MKKWGLKDSAACECGEEVGTGRQCSVECGEEVGTDRQCSI